MKLHICEPTDFCICSSTAAEPDEDCPVHGNPPMREVARCVHCGRFMPHKVRVFKNPNCFSRYPWWHKRAKKRTSKAQLTKFLREEFKKLKRWSDKKGPS